MDLSDSHLSLLLERARASDREAFGQLLELVRPYLTVLARAQIGQHLQGKADPADAVQETFVDALRDLPSFRGETPGELLAWLRQVLVRNLANLVRRYCQTQARDVRLEQQLSVGLDSSSSALGAAALAAAQSTPSEQAARAEMSLRVADTLERLPGDYRDVLVLRHLEGLSFPQVAQRMGRSTDSVEKLWVRGLARLRQLLGVAP
jgi:RNA polymerase sigma-70 factor (ECF subfamily)